MSKFTIRPMGRGDIHLAVEWAALEGWNPGLKDAETFYQTDPNGFFLGELNGEPIGCISAVSYDENFGFIGFYIVKPQDRGQGYGLQLWQAAMTYLGNRNIGLDGVVAQQENYQKSGFKLAYRNIRYQGKGGGTASTNTIPLSSIPFEQLLAYDRHLFPVARPQFLQDWIHQPESIALGVLNNAQLAGYGVLRPCQIGYKIGPLFANNDLIAEEIFNALVAEKVDAPIFLDLPEPNPAALALAQHYQMNPVFETARMYTQTTPNIPLDQVFGITTFELG